MGAKNMAQADTNCKRQKKKQLNSTAKFKGHITAHFNFPDKPKNIPDKNAKTKGQDEISHQQRQSLQIRKIFLQI